MEDGSAPPREIAGAARRNGAASENGAVARDGAAGQNGPLPLSARLLGAGVRGARSVGKATGIDKAVEVAAEEAIVAAIESEAVERAMARVLEGPVVEEAVQEALESDAVKRAVIEAMDSELVDEVWRRLLASEEAQQLVERIAGAPEVRAAISAQGAGLISDIGRTFSRITRRLDDTLENVARRILFRRRRPEPSPHAGLVSRGLAYLVDAAFVNLGFAAVAALVTLVDRLFGGSGEGGSGFAIAVGSTVWFLIGSLYLVTFWSLVGETPGMRFIGIRVSVDELGLRRSLRRLLGLYLSVVTFGIGFLGILLREDRRGWEDRLSAADVLYEDRRPDSAPWSQPRTPVAAEAETQRLAAATPEPPSGSGAGAAPPA
ncbi:MAG: RDD family protein [Syntrophothermus sp.]